MTERDADTPRLLWVAYAFFFGGGAMVLAGALGLWRRARAATPGALSAGLRVGLWLALMALAAGLLWPGRFGLAALAVLAATFCFSAAPRRA